MVKPPARRQPDQTLIKDAFGMTKRNKIKNIQNESGNADLMYTKHNKKIVEPFDFSYMFSSVNFASYFSRMSIEKYLDRFENNDPEDSENDNLQGKRIYNFLLNFHNQVKKGAGCKNPNQLAKIRETVTLGESSLSNLIKIVRNRQAQAWALSP